ncbi:hypothetical protein ACQZV8_13530 [Magnetococcales bacterium HHB-1]
MSGKGKEEVKGARMTSFLTKAHAEHSYLEIHIGGRDQTLFAYFADHPPQPAEDEEIVDGSISGELYEPLSYLRQGDHLVISHMTPPEVIEELDVGVKLNLLFFDGVKGVEAAVNFRGEEQIEGERCLILSFPKSIFVSDKRRYFRSPVIKNMPVKIMEPFEASVLDLSQGGLAFCFPEDAGQIDEGTEVNLKLVIPSSVELEEEVKMESGLQIEKKANRVLDIKSVIRNYAQPEQKGEGTICQGVRCGTQFYVDDSSHALTLGEVYNHVQREYLRTKKGKKKKPIKAEDVLNAKAPSVWKQLKGLVRGK